MAGHEESFRNEPPTLRPPHIEEVWDAQADRSPKNDRPPTSEECTSAVICHVGGFLTFVIIPLILWLVNKEKSRFVTEHAKEALNFQLTCTIYYIVGCLIFPVVIVYETWYVVKACLAASRGEPYRIPLNIRFVK